MGCKSVQVLWREAQTAAEASASIMRLLQHTEDSSTLLLDKWACWFRVGELLQPGGDNGSTRWLLRRLRTRRMSHPSRCESHQTKWLTVLLVTFRGLKAYEEQCQRHLVWKADKRNDWENRNAGYPLKLWYACIVIEKVKWSKMYETKLS